MNLNPDSPGLRAIPRFPHPAPEDGAQETGTLWRGRPLVVPPRPGAGCGAVRAFPLGCGWSVRFSSASPPCTQGRRVLPMRTGKSSFRWTQQSWNPMTRAPNDRGSGFSGRFHKPVHCCGWTGKTLDVTPSTAATGSIRRPGRPSVKSREPYRRVWQGSTPPGPPCGGRIFPYT